MKTSLKNRGYAHYFWSLLRYKPLITLANLICNVMIFGHGTAMSYLTREILNRLDTGVTGGVMRDISTLLILIMVISLARVAAIMACAVLDAMRGYYYQNRTRLNVLQTVYKRQDITRVVGASGAVFEALDDDVPACTFPPELLTEVLGFFICALVTLGILISISWQVTLLIFLPLSVSIYGIQRLSERMKERKRVNRAAHDDISSFIGDVADSILTIKTTGAQGAVLDALDARNARRRKAVLADALFNAKVGVFLTASMKIGMIIMMLVFAWAASGGGFRLGDFSIFCASLFVLADCVNRFAELVYEARKAEVSYERLLDAGDIRAGCITADAGLTLLKPDVYTPRSRTHTPFNGLNTRGLSFAYEGGGGFHDIDLDALPGTITAVAGGVGSGKSALLSVMSGHMLPSSGAIHINNLLAGADGIPLTPPLMASAAQGAQFFSADIAENLRMGHPLSEDVLWDALRRAALDGDVKGMSDGLSSPVGNRGGALSGGQRQRLALARLYAHDAGILIIDDNMSALDDDTRARVLEGLRDYIVQGGRIAIAASNDRNLLKHADQILVLEGGRVTARGTYKELMEGSEAFRGMVV